MAVKHIDKSVKKESEESGRGPYIWDYNVFFAK